MDGLLNFMFNAHLSDSLSLIGTLYQFIENVSIWVSTTSVWDGVGWGLHIKVDRFASYPKSSRLHPEEV